MTREQVLERRLNRARETINRLATKAGHFDSLRGNIFDALRAAGLPPEVDCNAVRRIELLAKQRDEYQNELESRRIDSAQLERMVNAIEEATPHFQSMLGSPSDHAEAALNHLIKERDELRNSLGHMVFWAEQGNLTDHKPAGFAILNAKAALAIPQPKK